MTWRYIKHFAIFFVLLECGLQGLHFNVVRELFFAQFSASAVITILWNIVDVFFFLLIIGGFFKYLRAGGLDGLVGYFKWIFCSLVLMFIFNVRLFFFFFTEQELILAIEKFDFDFSIFIARFFLIILAILFIALLYYDMVSKNLFVIELPFLVSLLLWFFLLTVRSFNFLFLFLLMESITLLIVVILSIYFVFFGAKLLKPVIHFFVFNLIISTFFLLGLGLLFFVIPVSGSENISYLMVLINFWTLFVSDFMDPLILLFVFKFSVLCFLLPFLFKLTLAPFSFWVVNIYSQLPTIFLFVLMGLYKFIYVLLFLKIFVYILDLVTVFQGTISLSLVWCIIPSMFVGCFAYRSADLKTILSLTTVSQLGYILAGLVSHDVMAIKYAIVYILVYIINLSGIFIIFVKLQKDFFLVNLNQLFLIKNYSKKWFYILFVLFASLAGFPPFAGFFLKYFLFLHIYKSGFFVLAFTGVISGYIMSIIYLQILMELSLIRAIPWAHYQSFIISGLRCTSSRPATNHAVNAMKFTQQVYTFLNFSIVFFFFINTFFIFFFPFLSHYFGLFTFFFVYGLYWNSEVPLVKQEMVWFANGFVDLPVHVEKDSSLTSFYKLTVNINRQLDAYFFMEPHKNDLVTIDFSQQSMSLFSANDKFSEQILQKYSEQIHKSADSIAICFEKGRSGQLMATSYFTAWYIPSITMEEYMLPLDWFAEQILNDPAFFKATSLFEYLNSRWVFYPMIDIDIVDKGMLFPEKAFLGNAFYDAEFNLLTRSSAYDVYSKHVFGYYLWFARSPRILYEIGKPPLETYLDSPHLGYVLGIVDAPEPDWSKFSFFNPTTDDQYLFYYRALVDLSAAPVPPGVVVPEVSFSNSDPGFDPNFKNTPEYKAFIERLQRQ